jgi:hypothetical protein
MRARPSLSLSFGGLLESDYKWTSPPILQKCQPISAHACQGGLRSCHSVLGHEFLHLVPSTPSAPPRCLLQASCAAPGPTAVRAFVQQTSCTTFSALTRTTTVPVKLMPHTRKMHHIAPGPLPRPGLQGFRISSPGCATADFHLQSFSMS